MVLGNQWVRVFDLRLSRSAAMAQQLIGEAFRGILNCDRHRPYNVLSLEERQCWWTHLRSDLIAMAERSGDSRGIGQELLGLQQQLFERWHAWREGHISRMELGTTAEGIRQDFAAKLEWAAVPVKPHRWHGHWEPARCC